MERRLTSQQQGELKKEGNRFEKLISTSHQENRDTKKLDTDPRDRK